MSVLIFVLMASMPTSHVDLLDTYSERRCEAIKAQIERAKTTGRKYTCRILVTTK